MTDFSRLQNISPSEVRQVASDMLFAACGYEPRCRALPSALLQQTRHRHALDLRADADENYRANRLWFRETAFDLHDTLDPSFDLIALFNAAVADVKAGLRRPITVTIDVSSMTGVLIALFVECVWRNAEFIEEARFVYELSNYHPPPTQLAPVEVSEPITPLFSGPLLDASKPYAVLIGLGYEPGRALGCLDTFEPAITRLFLPAGPDARFLRDVRDCNSDLLDLVPASDAIKFDPTDPLSTIELLDSMCMGLQAAGMRIVIVPMGPKIFRLAACVCSLNRSFGQCVWRISGGSRDRPVPRVGSGVGVGLRVMLAGRAA